MHSHVCLLKPMVFTKIKRANHGHRTSPHWGWLPPCADVCWKLPSAAPKSCRVRSRVPGRWPALYGTITMFFVGLKKRWIYIYIYIYIYELISKLVWHHEFWEKSQFFSIDCCIMGSFKIEIPGLSMGKTISGRGMVQTRGIYHAFVAILMGKWDSKVL